MGKLVESVIEKLIASGFDRDSAIEIACKAYNPDQPRADNGQFGEGGGGATGGSGGSGGGSSGDKPKPPKKPRAPRKPKPEAAAATISREKPPEKGPEVDALLNETRGQFTEIAKKDPDLANAIGSWAATDYSSIRAMQQGTYKEPYEGAKARIEKKLGSMEKGFEKLPKYDGQITRELANVDPSSFKEGGSFEVDAFSSFTAKPSWGQGEKPAVRLVVKKNTSGRAIWGMAREEEAEVLVPKGTKYRIASISKGKPTEVHLEEIAPGKDGTDISAVVNAALNEMPGGRNRDESEEGKSADWDWTHFEDRVNTLVKAGYSELVAVEIAKEALDLEKGSRDRDSQGRFKR